MTDCNLRELHVLLSWFLIDDSWIFSLHFPLFCGWISISSVLLNDWDLWQLYRLCTVMVTISVGLIIVFDLWGGQYSAWYCKKGKMLNHRNIPHIFNSYLPVSPLCPCSLQTIKHFKTGQQGWKLQYFHFFSLSVKMAGFPKGRRFLCTGTWQIIL